MGHSDWASYRLSFWVAEPEEISLMQGFVNQNCEAMLPIVVGRDNKPTQLVEALIDTGFTGFLSLPLSMIESLGLPWIFSS